ncbi:MAG: tetratricopeptide repeat protein [Acidobacteria bacterium]|nr:tetratricopeptide repeat protein [Acidobacteriota bacterium]MBI3424048.1 tetratricopeptide repeat protein [Acidobacteriota bacterium]
MKQLWLAVILLFSIASCAWAQTPASPLAEARALFDAGRYDEVIQKLSASANPPTADREAAYLLGMSWYQKREYQRAIPYLQTVLRAGNEAPGNSPIIREYRESIQVLGLSHYLLGHLAEAVPLLEQASAGLPNSHELSYALGMACIQTRQPDRARAAFARMFQVAPASAAAHLLTAQMMVRVEFEEFAEAELKQALELDPKLPQANYLLGQIAVYKGRVDEGIALLERELALNPGNANAYYKLGDAYTRQLKWDEAIAALQKSVWLYPFYSGPYILLGKSYMKKRQMPNAEAMLKRALQFDPNNKSAHYMLAQVYQQTGHAEDAKREFAIAEKLQGNAEEK